MSDYKQGTADRPLYDNIKPVLLFIFFCDPSVLGEVLEQGRHGSYDSGGKSTQQMVALMSQTLKTFTQFHCCRPRTIFKHTLCSRAC